MSTRMVTLDYPSGEFGARRYDQGLRRESILGRIIDTFATYLMGKKTHPGVQICRI